MIRLCSGSVTRAEILEELAVDFIQNPVDFDEESIEETDPYKFVYRAMLGKLQAASREYQADIPLLAADTVVTARGKLLRKPRNMEEAREILLCQSGAETVIITCVGYEENAFSLTDLSETRYQFAPFDRDALETYLQSGEWSGKAGGCMVEGFCKPYIRSMAGLESCARGLTVEKLLPFLRRPA